MRQRVSSLFTALPGHAREAFYSPRVRLGAVATLLALLALLLLPRLLPGTSSEEFMVLVAPFRERAGAGQTGRAVAQDLVRAIEEHTSGAVSAQLLDTPPASAADAARIARQRSADVVIFGEVTPGGLLDQESLLPEIVYQPTGSFAPAAWDGYLGRFALPT
ncbi:MAG TPA: hypothetical protein VNL77_07830, partial [Roseiflexaceae bacterium]|nr:hypothetical protein [Roseiflexaceae bacterium]